MLSNLLQRLSGWNPQFFREVKGRLKPRNAVMTIAASLVGQFLFMLYFWMTLPDAKITAYSQYCTGAQEQYSSFRKCILDAAGFPQIDWQAWWFNIFQVLSWSIPFVLLTAGVYMLVGNLAKEERRGTLNFIRLSPQTSRSILLGKLLGVPLLPMLGVIVAVPLHAIAAVHANVHLAEVISIYLITIAACCFFYTASVFYAFLGAAHGALAAVAVSFVYMIVLQGWLTSQSYYYSSSRSYLFLGEWYHIQVGESLSLFVTFSVLTLTIGTVWNWLAINRRFRNPNQVLVSKRQSYWMTLSFEVFIFGFVFRTYPAYYDEYSRFAFNDLMLLMGANLFWYPLIIAALTPYRQILLDWARYRTDGTTKHLRKAWRRALLQELLWRDKSPAILAIVLNLAIPLVLFTPWILTWSDNSPVLAGIAGLILNLLFLLVCAAIVQLIQFSKVKHSAIIATGLIAGLIALPPLGMMVVGATPNKATALLWLLSAFPFAAITLAPAIAIGFSILGYLVAFTLLLGQQTRLLKKAGESELKALMASKMR